MNIKIVQLWPKKSSYEKKIVQMNIKIVQMKYSSNDKKIVQMNIKIVQMK